MLQLKISKTKKRLSDEKFLYRNVTIAVAAVFVCLGYAFRASTMATPFGYIAMEIPVSQGPESGKPDKLPIVNRQAAETTPLLILTDQKFLFGSVEAFTTDLSSVADKISIAHIDGAPHMSKLVAAVQNWSGAKTSSDVLFFLPDKNIPVAIVIKVVAGLKEHTKYNRIVLASGLM
jgi:hypothetical protein